MPRYVIDSYAWIEYFIGSNRGLKVRDIIESQSNDLFTPTIVISEVVSITKREKKDFDSVYDKMIALSRIYDLNKEMAKEAGIAHAEIRKRMNDFGMADTIVLLLAKKIDAKIVTGDPHFRTFKEVIFI